MNSGLKWRLPLAALIIVALAALAWADVHAARPGMVLLGLAVAAAVLGADELRTLYRTQRGATFGWLTPACTAAVVASSAAPVFWPDTPLGRLGWPLVVLAAGLGVLFLGEMRRYQRPGTVIESLPLSALTIVYVGLPLSFAVQLRLLDPGGRGIAAVISMIAVVKLCDTGAYTFGRIFGRHKMAPRISPGKTWEGAAGGLALAVLGSYLIFEQILPRCDFSTGAGSTGLPLGWLIFGLAVGGAGMLGDLAESLLKRDAGQKDSSTWMPGFGGVLDILDSILAAAPVAYLLWAAGVVGK